MNTLIIGTKEFKKGYDMDFTPYIESDYTGITYIPWANALMLLRKLHPGLEIGYEKDEYIDNKSIQGAVKEACQRLEYDLEQANSDKERKKLRKALQEQYDLYSYTDRGVAVKPYLYDANGKRSTVLYFPVMDSTNRFIPSPTSRDISDAKVRGAVKAIAWVTGIGLRLWTREDLDIRKNDNNHPKFKGLNAINNRKMDILTDFGYLPDYWVDPDFGWNIHELREFHRKIKTFDGTLSFDDDKTTAIDPIQALVNSWKNPMAGVDWAVKQGLTADAAASLLTECGKDKRGYYHKVMELVNNPENAIREVVSEEDEVTVALKYM